VGFGQGRKRSFRPFPRQRTCAPAPSETSSCRNPVISLNRQARSVRGDSERHGHGPSQPLRSIRRRQQRLDLGPGSESPPSARRCRWFGIANTRWMIPPCAALPARRSGKRPDGRQTQSSGSWRHCSGCFPRSSQKRPDQRASRSSSPQLRGGLMLAVSGRTATAGGTCREGGDGVRADFALRPSNG